MFSQSNSSHEVQGKDRLGTTLPHRQPATEMKLHEHDSQTLPRRPASLFTLRSLAGCGLSATRPTRSTVGCHDNSMQLAFSSPVWTALLSSVELEWPWVAGLRLVERLAMSTCLQIVKFENALDPLDRKYHGIGLLLFQLKAPLF